MKTYLEKRNWLKNQTRFYSMAVLPNLFGEWTLRREWGSIGVPGQVHLDLYQSQADAEDVLLTLVNRKRRRGYFMEPQQLPIFPDAHVPIITIQKEPQWQTQSLNPLSGV